MWATHGVEEVWERYFDALGKLAPHVDVLAHPDLPKIFGQRPQRPDRFYPRLNGVALEISTAGLRKPIGELYPDYALLRANRANGITLASDAHEPDLVGMDFEAALELAED